jgi:hypothetical protein
LKKSVGGARMGRLQMEVGNEQRKHARGSGHRGIR